MDKLGSYVLTEAVTRRTWSKDKAATGEKHSRIHRSIERDKVDHCKRQIVGILRHRESLDAEIRRTIKRREEILLLNDFTDEMRSAVDEMMEIVNSWNIEVFNNNDELADAREALVREVTRMKKFILHAKGELRWMRTMLVGTETYLNFQKREYEAVYTCLNVTLAAIAKSRGNGVVKHHRLQGEEQRM